MDWNRTTKKAIELLFHLLFLTVPLVWTNSTSELFEFPKMLTVYVFSILIGGLFLVRRVVADHRKLERKAFDIPLLIFLTTQILATLFSINKHTSLIGYYSRFHGGLLSTISYLVLYFVYVNSFDWNGAKKHLKSLLVGGLLASLYAIPEHFGVSFSCIALGSGATASCWVQDVISRIFGTFGQPNWLAAYMITVVFVPMASTISNLKNHKSIRHLADKNQILNYLLVGIFFATLLFTKSRSGLLGMGVGILIFSILVLWKQKAKTQVVKLLATYYLLLATVFILFGKSLVPVYDSLVNSMAGNNEITAVDETNDGQPVVGGTQLETGGTESGEIRQIVWQGAMDIWKRYPLFGSGVETFAYAYNGSRPVEHNLVSEWDFLYNKAHNEWLNFAATTGTFGLVSYLLIIGWFGVTSFGLISDPGTGKQEPGSRFLVAALLSGYVALGVSNFFGFSTVPVGVLFFMFPAMVAVYNNKPTSEESVLELSPGKWIKVAMIGLVMVALLFQVNKVLKADRLYAQGKKYSRNNQLTDAINAINAAVKLKPKEPVYQDELAKTAAKVALGLVSEDEESAGQFARLAVGFHQASLNENPYYLPYYKTGANVLVNMAVFDDGYLDDAEQLLLRAIGLAPTDPKIRLTLGLVYIQQERLDEAQFAIEKAVQLKPNYEQARYSLGLIYHDLEKLGQAREQYEYILNFIQPDNRLVKEALAELGEE